MAYSLWHLCNGFVISTVGCTHSLPLLESCRLKLLPKAPVPGEPARPNPPYEPTRHVVQDKPNAHWHPRHGSHCRRTRVPGLHLQPCPSSSRRGVVEVGITTGARRSAGTR